MSRFTILVDADSLPDFADPERTPDVRLRQLTNAAARKYRVEIIDVRDGWPEDRRPHETAMAAGGAE